MDKQEEALEGLAKLKEMWRGAEVVPPNESAMKGARLLLRIAKDQERKPFYGIGPEVVEGGVEFCYVSGARYASIIVDNENCLWITRSDRNVEGDLGCYDLEATEENIKQALKQIEEYIYHA